MSENPVDRDLRNMLDCLSPGQLLRLRDLVDARTGSPLPQPAGGPAAYRGVPVPEDQPETLRWYQGVDAALDAAIPLVEALSSGEPCVFNGYGICEVHDLDASGPCPDGEAQAFLTASRKDDGT